MSEEERQTRCFESGRKFMAELAGYGLTPLEIISVLEVTKFEILCFISPQTPCSTTASPSQS